MKEGGRRRTRTALQQGLHYLSRRCLSVWEMEKRLKKARYPQDECEQAISKLQEWDYLDDKKFACAYARMKKDCFSRNRIAGELARRGVARGCIEEALADEYSEEEELAVCRLRMLKEWEKMDMPADLSRQGGQKKLECFKAGFARKGFPCESIQKIVNEEPERFFPINARDA